MSELPAGTTKDALPNLDGLRGIAVLLVVLQHIPQAGMPGAMQQLLLYLQPGYLGVDIFFVLSGFLITRILLVDRARGWPLHNFLIRRCLRIFPIFYLTVAVMAVLRPGPELPWVASYLFNLWLPSHPTSTPLTHTWSLCVEEHFYLVWPALVYLAGPRWARRGALFVLIPAAIGTAIWVTAEQPLFEARRIVQVITPVRALSLLAGAALAWHEGLLRGRGVACARVAVVAGALGWGLSYLGITNATLQPWFPVWWLLGFALLSTSLVVIAVGLDGRPHLVSRALTFGPLRRIGRISYGLYLYHPLVFWALGLHGMGRSHDPGWGRIALAVGLSVLLAEASFALIERPILRLQARFRPG